VTPEEILTAGLKKVICGACRKYGLFKTHLVCRTAIETLRAAKA
jgi:hypothetical protein